jgi:prepilin peptidase CpaA
MAFPIDFLLTPFLIVWLVAAAWRDWRTRRIPNALTLSGILCALLLRLAAGPPAFLEGLGGGGAALLLGLVSLQFGVLGGGDAKLLTMLGAFLGPISFLYSLIPFGGALALVDTARRGTLLPVLHGTLGWARRWLPVGPPLPVLPLKGTTGIPYGVAIAAGGIATWLLTHGVAR